LGADAVAQMQGKWRDSKPCHIFEASHLKIKYDVANEMAAGFMLYEKIEGEYRKYIYEAYFRIDRWKIAFTTGDPNNNKPFSDRDRDTSRFREIKGVPRFHRQDLARDLNLKLCKFRDNILREEKIYQKKKDNTKFIATGRSDDDYWLLDNLLIRVVKTPFRQAFVAMNLPDACLDTIATYIF
jgi:hypothetical protein